MREKKRNVVTCQVVGTCELRKRGNVSSGGYMRAKKTWKRGNVSIGGYMRAKETWKRVQWWVHAS